MNSEENEIRKNFTAKERINFNRFKKKNNVLSIALTNARSVMPKLYSLTETMRELCTDICVITETWIREDDKIKENIEDYQNITGFFMIRKDRLDRRGGGVAICYNAETIEMSKVKIPCSEFEIVAAIGRRTGQRRKVLVVAVYLPPSYDADQTHRCLSKVNDTVLALKRRYDNPYVIVAGDFNRRDAKKATADFSEMKIVGTPPTRGRQVLDIIQTSFNELLIDSGVVDPIECVEGIRSDHKTVFAKFRMPRVPSYDTQSYEYFHVTGEACKKFATWAKQQKWQEVTQASTSSEKVAALEKTLEVGMMESFVKKQRVKKSSEPPWMTGEIRQWIVRRRAIFRRCGRNAAWKKLKRRTTAAIKRRRTGYNAHLREKFMSGKGTGGFHHCVKSILNGNTAQKWNVRSLYPGATDKETAENLAAFFNGISSQYEPLRNDQIPTTYSEEIPELTVADVLKRIKEMRKPNSQVPGDVHPRVYELGAPHMASPITDIFNCILRTKEWPARWKIEYVTVIPKVKSPTEENQCRNISCTAFLSKVFESFILQWAREKVKLGNTQYGGEKGCSTSHLIIDMLQEITTTMEDRRAASILMSIDYSKAFNRLKHAPCLEALAKKGASSELLQIIASFLQGRSMTVKSGKAWSDLKLVNAGAPQGSVLGGFLFNVGIDDIELGCQYPEEPFVDTMEAHARDTDYPAALTPRRVGKPHEEVQESPIRTNPLTNQEMRLLPSATNTPPWLRQAKEQTWHEREPVDLKFIDDGVNITAINMKTVAMYTDAEGKNIKRVHPVKAQAMMKHITKKAAEKGMIVNGAKTTLMCVNSAYSYTASAELMAENGERITSVPKAKYLGVTIDADCTLRSHVKDVRNKMRARSWALVKLRQSGFTAEELVKTYCSHVRPVAEYAAVSWTSLITKEQSDSLEQQQSQALKNIYGLGISARKMREMAGIKTLQERREAAAIKFARKNAASERFSHWFKERKPCLLYTSPSPRDRQKSRMPSSA